MLRNIGWGEVLIVLAIILVVFGAAKLPQMAQSLGRSLTSFKKGLRETAEDVKDAIKEEVSADIEAEADSKAKTEAKPTKTKGGSSKS